MSSSRANPYGFYQKNRTESSVSSGKAHAEVVAPLEKLLGALSRMNAINPHPHNQSAEAIMASLVSETRHVISPVSTANDEIPNSQAPTP